MQTVEMFTRELKDGTVYPKVQVMDIENPPKGLFTITYKIDGIRAIRGKDGVIYSRASKVLRHLDHLKFNDAEVFRKDWNTTHSIISSITPPTTPITQSEIYELTYDDMDERLYKGTIINPTPLQLKQELIDALNRGYEGLVLYKYEAKRIREKDFLRVKRYKVVPTLEGDYKILNIIEGTGKNKNSTGNVLTTGGSVGVIKSNFMPGLTDKEIRDELFNNKKSYIGKIVTITFREKTSGGKLRFPILSRLRLDKDEESPVL